MAHCVSCCIFHCEYTCGSRKMWIGLTLWIRIARHVQVQNEFFSRFILLLWSYFRNVRVYKQVYIYIFVYLWMNMYAFLLFVCCMSSLDIFIKYYWNTLKLQLINCSFKRYIICLRLNCLVYASKFFFEKNSFSLVKLIFWMEYSVNYFNEFLKMHNYPSFVSS